MSTTMADWMDELSPEFREKLEGLRAEALKKAYSYSKTPMASGTIPTSAHYGYDFSTADFAPEPVRDYPARHGTKYGNIFGMVWALMEQNYQKSYTPSKSYAMSASVPASFSVHYSGAKFGAGIKPTPAMFVGGHSIKPTSIAPLSWSPVTQADIQSSVPLSAIQMQGLSNQVNAGILGAQVATQANLDQQTYFKLQTIKDYFSGANKGA